jgi:hypothetical protein
MAMPCAAPGRPAASAPSADEQHKRRAGDAQIARKPHVRPLIRALTSVPEPPLESLAGLSVYTGQLDQAGLLVS